MTLRLRSTQVTSRVVEAPFPPPESWMTDLVAPLDRTAMLVTWSWDFSGGCGRVVPLDYGHGRRVVVSLGGRVRA